MRFVTLMTLLLTGLNVISAPSVAAAENKTAAITFSADYCKTADSVDALQSNGSPAGRLMLADKDKRDFDTMSHSIRGLLVGEECASVFYETAQNLPEGKGSIELVIKPADWDPKDDLVHVFMQTVVSGKTPFGKMIIYKYKSSGVAVYLEYNENGDKIFLRDHQSLTWEPESWHHITVTYDLNKEVVLYVDGRSADSASIQADFKWPKLFSVGPSGKGMGYADGTTSISDVRIYDRPLTAEEVPMLAKGKLPDLDIKITAENKSTLIGKDVGTRSRWHETGRPALGLEALEGDTVLPPWTPVEVGSNSVSVWGRQYSLGNGGIMDSVVAAGAEVLSAPVNIVLENERVTFAEPKLVSQEKGRVVLTRSAVAKSADLTLTYTVEYDGLIWCELSLKPKQTISNLSLNIPFTAAASELMHYVGAPEKYESQNLIKHSNSKILSKDAGVIYRSGFKTTMWIGNNERGLLWFAESDQFWWPKDREDIITAERTGDGRLDLKLDVITQALPLKDQKELTIRFGLMATPVKPMPEGWRGWTYSAQYDPIKGEIRGNQLIYWPDEWRWMKLDPDPTRAQNVEKVRAKVVRDGSEGRKIIPYWTRIHAVATDGDKIEPDADYMRANWATEPNRPGGGSHQLFRTCATTGWGDYLVWCAEEWRNVFGHMDGVYMDETQPIPNTRAESNGGYDALDGSRRPTYEQFGSRNMIKRMTYNIWKQNGETPVSVAHCSATHTMQSLSMYAAMLIGEQYYNGYFTGRNPEFLPPPDDPVEYIYYYSYALPMDRVRAECYYGQWGAVMTWLPCLKFDKGLMANPVTARDMLSRIMQADMAIWPLFCNRDEVVKTWRFREAFGVADKAVEFIPYWDNESITADNENVLVGYYRNGDKILAIVSNLNRSAAKVKIAFGDLPVTSVKNAETGETISLNGTAVEIDILRNDYMALRINY